MTEPVASFPTSTLFSSLLEQSRKLRQGQDSGELPPIQLGLSEIERRAKELRRAPGGQQQTDARAYVSNPEGALLLWNANFIWGPYTDITYLLLEE